MFPRDLSDADLALLARRAERELLQVPAWATQRALAIAQGAAAAQTRLPAQVAQSLRRWVASLRFDSWQAQPQPALRSSAGAPRQLLFSIGSHDFDLRVQGADSRPGFIHLSGQVLGPATLGQVRWRPADSSDLPPAAAGEVALDDMGEFVAPEMRAGTYLLTVQLADGEVELPPLDLQAQRTG